MELILTRQAETQVLVTCDERSSHTFDLLTLIPDNNGLSHPLDDPVAYGKAIYQALFPPDTAAWSALNANPDRILFVATDDPIDAIPWEYAYGPDDFVVLEYHFVRGLPADQRIASPTLDKGLHIVAVPSNPLSHELEPLNIDGEWIRLKEIIQELKEFAIVLERTRPPTLERTGLLVSNQQQRIVHFMGHGGQDEKTGAILRFEKDNGDLDAVTARDFIRQIRDNVFLVTLNACVSASPGETLLSNLAASLVKQKIPYSLGMRFSIPDEDALTFSRTFYSYLARGSTVEEAAYQVRLALSRNRQCQWMIGVPLLYTSLSAPATGFASVAGTPEIKEYQPNTEVSALPRAEGAFQGRIDELIQLGDLLTGDRRPRLVTIYGSGGQGKTALAREAVERFAYAWPGGVWATSLENLPGREQFVNDLARFLGIPTQEILDPNEVERRVLAFLPQRRLLIVLDNAETLIDAVEAKYETAINFAQLLQQLPGLFVSLLVTSRVPLGWSGEELLELGGLSPKEGADLFMQCTPRRRHEIDATVAWDLSEKLGGHPLGLRLLGSAFNASMLSLRDFMQECDNYLLNAENKYQHPDHRHRTLTACIDISIRHLDTEQRALLSGLRVFHAPFLPETAIAIFDPESQDTKLLPSTINPRRNPLAVLWARGITRTEDAVALLEEPESEGAKLLRSPVRNHLRTLRQRGLLAYQTKIVRDGILLFYRLLPTMRPYVEHYLEQAYKRETLLARFGAVYSQLASHIHDELDTSAATVTIAQEIREDLEQGVAYVEGLERASYLLHWGWILQRLGSRKHGLDLLERALEIAQGQDQSLELKARSNIAEVYNATGQPQEALQLYEQVLLIMQEKGDQAGEAAILTNMAVVYRMMGKPQEALKLYEQALPIMREAGDRAGEATTLTNMATAYQVMGQRQQALKLCEAALRIHLTVGNRVMVATTLTSMAEVYRVTGQPLEALKLNEQALPIMREAGDRAGEAATLNNMADVYRATGQLQEALRLYEQAWSIMQEVDNRAGEAATLGNMAQVHQDAGKPQEALKLYEQALPIMREVGNRAGEATTLNNMADVYLSTGKPQEALKLYEQALPIMREVGNRAGEATTLNNMAEIYRATGKLQEALKLHEQVLPIRREVGDRAGEAATLNNMALVYQDAGKPQEALKLYEQVLPIAREVGVRIGEAATLGNMAGVYLSTGKLQEALKLNEQALLITREVGNRAGEATTLNNMAGVYLSTGKLQEALKLCEQALPITREVGDREGEAATLNNMALVYRATGKPQEALKLYEQALPITHEVGNRAGEATTLNNMAGVYLSTGKLQEALKLNEQALPITREVGNRAGEATTLNNMAEIYRATGKLQEALKLHEQVLPIRREVGDREGEAATLNNMALVYQATGKPQEALKLYEQALPIMREVGDRAGEAALLSNMAWLLYQLLNRQQDAITHMEQAIAVLVKTGLPQDGAGRTIEDLRRRLQAMRTGTSLGIPTRGASTMPAAHLQQIISNTVAVMTFAQDHHAEWRGDIASALQDAQQRGADWQIEVDLFTAILDILDGRSPALPANHPYAQTVAAIQAGIVAGAQIASISDEVLQAVRDFVNAEDWEATQKVVEVQQALLFRPEVETLFKQNIAQARASGDQRVVRMLELHLSILHECKTRGIAETFEQITAAQQASLPFDIELIPRSIAALQGDPQEKMKHMQYLAALDAQTTDAKLKALINTIQLALFGGDLSQLGQDLSGVYRQAWEAIVAGVKTEGEISS